MSYHISLSVSATLSIVLTFCVAIPEVEAQNVIYVGENATGVEDGSSWGTSYNHLQDALATAMPGDEIWMEQGIYHPDRGQDSNRYNKAASFTIPPGVSVYGGFQGTEETKAQRDIKSSDTILSGDLRDNDGEGLNPLDSERDDNAFSVITVSESLSSSPSLIDRLQISGGNAVDVQSSGGGMRILNESTVILQNVVFTRNYANACGGGVSVDNSTLLITKSEFIDNAAAFAGSFGCGSVSGGAIWIATSAESEQGLIPTVIDSVRFEDNRSGGCGGSVGTSRAPGTIIKSSQFIANEAIIGGALCIDGATDQNKGVILSNVMLRDNLATQFGGGAILADRDGKIEITNTIFNDNRATTSSGTFSPGGAILTDHNSMVDITNSTFINNSAEFAGAILDLGTASIHNSILWNNPTDDSHPLYGNDESEISFSISEQGAPPTFGDVGDKVLDQPPDFKDASGADEVPGTGDDDLTLQTGSVAVNNGNNDLLPSDEGDIDGDSIVKEVLPLDFSGNARVVEGTVDFGALESTSQVNSLDAYDTPHTGQCESISVYPNPVSSVVTLSAGGLFQVNQIEIYDLTGRRYHQTDNIEIGGVRISVSDYPTGYYIIRVTSSTRTCTFPIAIYHR